MSAVDASLMTSVPATGAALRIRTCYQQSIRRSFVALLDAITGIDEGTLEVARSWARALNTDRAFAPWVHARYFALYAAVCRNDGPRALELLDAVSAGPSETDYCDDIVIEGLPADPDEREILYAALAKHHYNDTPRDVHGPCSLGETQMVTHEHYIREALDSIRIVDPLIAKEIDSLVSRISLIEQCQITNMTDMQSFGRIYIHRVRTPETVPVDYMDAIVHEASHLRLHALMSFDPLVTNSPHERYPAPFRLDPRPMTGILHATFVLSRLVRLFARLGDTERLSYARQRFTRGLSIIDDYAVLTPLGATVVRSLLQTACSHG